jgi:thiol-disulfide isomerase/thioredoxin
VKSLPFLLCAILLVLPCSGADTGGAKKEIATASIAEKLAAAEADFHKSRAAMPDTKEANDAQRKLGEELDRKREQIMADGMALVKANPKSDAAFEALNAVLSLVHTFYLPDGPEALQLMAEHHAANPGIGPMIALLSYYPPNSKDPAHAPATNLLHAVATQNPDRTARGQALLGLAWLKKRMFDRNQSDPAAQPDQLAAEAEKALQQVIREYGDCKNLRTIGARPPAPTLGDEARPDLFELRYLRIGKPAPAITAVDLDGQTFSLSDYKGKAVLLVFWAAWCGPCMAAVPHEKELAERFKGRPFALLGVNGDGDLKGAKKAVREFQIPWRSFWNGEKGAGGPIAVAWNVRGWPTTYLIDHEGIIRHKELHGEYIDGPLEKMIVAAEKR